MTRFKQKWTKDRKQVEIADLETKYNLFLTFVDGPLKFCHTDFHSKPHMAGLYITGRDITEYDSDIKTLKLNPLHQYVEIGAGLGEFTPRLIETFGSRLKNKPIVIDPGNYSVMADLLNYALTLSIEDRMKVKLRRLNQRCEIIRDPKQVKLINLTLEEAITQHPEILGIADVVIDNAGASHYTEHEHAWELEGKLLKPNGLLFAEVIRSGICAKPSTPQL